VTKHCWNVIRTSGAFEHRTGVMVATDGKTINVGDVLTLPPDNGSWRVVDVREVVHDPGRGIVTLDAIP